MIIMMQASGDVVINSENPTETDNKLQILIFLVDSKSETQDSSITDECISIVENQLKDISGNHLYLVLQTYGGDPFSAVRIMKIVQEKFKKISAIIPSHSTSAGTLMALGCDEIYMQHKSMLGPLDLPIEHPSDGSRISALDVQNTMSNIAALSNSFANARYRQLRYENRIGKIEAAKIAYTTATEFVEPIVRQIDPFHLQKSNRELLIGWTYAYYLLSSRMMKHDKFLAYQSAKKLVNDYPAHEFGIFADEAQENLKLIIKPLSELQEGSEILQVFDTILTTNHYAIVYKEI